jgi:uncharacterized protein (TIGR02145 family)
MKTKNLLYSAGLFALLLAACAEDNYPAKPDNGGSIAFSTAPLRGLRANIASEETFKSFTVSAYGRPNPGNYDKYVINGATVTRGEGAGSSWNYFPKAYFPMTGLVDFFAYSPASSVNIQTGLQQADVTTPPASAGPSIAYQVPTAAAMQEDFLVAKNPGQANNANAVNLDFKHALSRIDFKARTIAQGKTYVIEGLSLSHLCSTGTLAMKDSLPDGNAPFDYSQGEKTVWKDPTGYENYSVDLGTTQVYVPYASGDTYTSITTASNGLMVMPQETDLGAFTDPAAVQGLFGGIADDDATYLSVTYAEVDPSTGVSGTPETVYFLIMDPHDTNKGIVFEAGRQYTFSFTLGDAGISFDKPSITGFDDAPYVDFPMPPFLPHVNSIVLTPWETRSPMDYGDTLTVFATVGPDYAGNKAIRWELRNVVPEGSITLENETATSVRLKASDTWLDATADLVAIAQDGGGCVSPAYKDTVGCGTSTILGLSGVYAYDISYFGSAGCWTTQSMRETANLTPGTNAGTNYTLKYYTSTSGTGYDDTMGLLYTWAAATDQTAVGSGGSNDKYQGICPTNWHVPSHNEWVALGNVIWTDTKQKYYTLGVVTDSKGARMKSVTLVNNTAPNGTSNASNAHGFNAQLMGWYLDGVTDWFGRGAYFWTSQSTATDKARSAFLYNLGPDLQFYDNFKGSYLFAVRCRKN